MKLYISGQISGLNLNEAKATFKAVEDVLVKTGCEVINPFNLFKEQDLTWSEFMVVDIKALLDCNAIIMLKGWEKSKGSRLEKKIEKELDYHIIYE